MKNENGTWIAEGEESKEHKKELTKRELLDLLGNYFTVAEIYGIKKVKQKPGFTKKALRSLLVAGKRADVLGLRYKLTGKGFRRSLDAQTAPWDANIWPL